MNKQITIIAGPCVIETMDVLEEVAQELVRLNRKYDLSIIFKASFDKANRTSIHSYRGPGLEKGLRAGGREVEVRTADPYRYP